MVENVRAIPAYFLRPLNLFRTYNRGDLRADLVAGLTIGAILLPQGIAFALVAGLPPEMGLYAAVVAAIVAALWGSSNHLHTGPTNAASILVLSTLLPLAEPGTSVYIAAAGLLALLSGVFRLAMGLAGLGMLVNFVSVAVIIGFTAGAGVLILVGELRHLFRLSAPGSAGLIPSLVNLAQQLSSAHLASVAIGLGTLSLVLLVPRIAPRFPSSLVALVAATAAVGVLRLDRYGVRIIGELKGGLPPLAHLPLLDYELVAQVATGALAVAAIGLVEATAIARSIASQTGQRLDNNQEFVGQGLANIACGILSGFPCSGSFNRSALTFKAAARTPMASVISGVVVLLAMLFLGPLASFLPRAALAGVLIVAAYGMIDRAEIVRIWNGARGDAWIMIVTLGTALFLPLQFAVLAGILLSLAYYILKTSAPRVISVVPDDNFRHWTAQDPKPGCPQLGVIDIRGDLYFGAVGHIEQAIQRHSALHPRQRFLLLRLHGVHHCDISGIHGLENIVRSYRERGGDVFMVRVDPAVLRLMRTTGFYAFLGADNFLSEDHAVEHLFYKVLDPAICVYESDVRVFRECQNLPRPDYPIEIALATDLPRDRVPDVTPQLLWNELRSTTPPVVVDVREPREFKRGHIPQAQLVPLGKLLVDPPELPDLRTVVLVCQSGRRSTRAAATLRSKGRKNVIILRGGMLAWEAAGLIEAVE